MEKMQASEVADWVSTLDAFLSEEEVALLKECVLDQGVNGEAFDKHLTDCSLGDLSADLASKLTGRTMVRIRKAWRADNSTPSAIASPVTKAACSSPRPEATYAPPPGHTIAGLIRTEERHDLAPRPVCTAGLACRTREEAHCAEYAHVFDSDYFRCCETAGVEPEQRSLLSLFNWIDVNDRKKIPVSEVQAAVPILASVLAHDIRVTDVSWRMLDEDGNGWVSFQEFAAWMGPRCGLPLGVQHLFHSCDSGKFADSAVACGIVGCACPGFEPLASGERAKRRHFACYPMHLEKSRMCRCGHKESAHEHNNEDEIPYPAYWKCVGIFEFCDMVPVDSTLLPLFQEFFDQTHLKIWTKDRRKHNTGGRGEKMPKGYRVIGVKRNENSKAWRAYAIRRAVHLENAKPKQVDDVKSTLAWKTIGGPGHDHLADACNEWILVHGTNEKNARSICRNNFKMSLAGGTTGTLYGCGTYLAESVTKADEYAKEDAGEICTMMICRALGGNVNYTAEVEPNADELLEGCTEGPYDCVMGDREKCRKTYREFVFFDAQSIYCEYLVAYKRLY
eukprot:TRINITY_DN47617_c0_g1_i1.p1 TRINITY_DN47617_c0_g1~~TRINITY_DN47617_c0_g1_i1.p1  ORF type:complete len:563 (-),score=55.65 TRINITY_DN47617_c0_g1_i1:449-2137(-)